MKKNFTTKPKATVFLALSVFLVLGVTLMLYAYAGGRAGCTKLSGNSGCSCHSSSGSFIVTINGPDTLAPGATGTYSLTINKSGSWKGGCDIAVSAGTLAIGGGGTYLKLLSGELVQKARINNSNALEIPFSYTAPGSSTTITMAATGMSGTGSGTSLPWLFAENKTIVVMNLTNVHNYTNTVPNSFELYQNYPNPFNPTTNIKFDIPKSSFVTLKVYNMVGQEVATPVNGNLNAGSYESSFDASKLSSGVYFYKLVTNDFVQIKKMNLVK